MLWLAMPLEAGCVVLLGLFWVRLRAIESRVAAMRIGLAEIRCYAEARTRLQQQQKQFEQAVEGTTNSVETVHRALANLSFDLWGNDSRDLRARHDVHAERLYDGVRRVNRSLGRLTGNLLGGDRRDDD